MMMSSSSLSVVVVLVFNSSICPSRERILFFSSVIWASAAIVAWCAFVEEATRRSLRLRNSFISPSSKSRASSRCFISSLALVWASFCCSNARLTVSVLMGPSTVRPVFSKSAFVAAYCNSKSAYFFSLWAFASGTLRSKSWVCFLFAFSNACASCNTFSAALRSSTMGLMKVS